MQTGYRPGRGNLHNDSTAVKQPGDTEIIEPEFLDSLAEQIEKQDIKPGDGVDVIFDSCGGAVDAAFTIAALFDRMQIEGVEWRLYVGGRDLEYARWGTSCSLPRCPRGVPAGGLGRPGIRHGGLHSELGGFGGAGQDHRRFRGRGCRGRGSDSRGFRGRGCRGRYRLFDDTYVFLPTTGPKWRALKAAGVE